MSPYIWGADVKTCPALDYTWVTDTPADAYRKYRDGLDELRKQAHPFGG